MKVAASIVAATLALAASSLSVSAQTWPDKPIKLIVTFAAGGGTDMVARVAAKHMSSRLGQSVYVENRGGANGIVGMQAIRQSAPDGYTIGAISDGPMVFNHGLYKEKLPYDSLRDFTSIHMLNKFTGMIVVNPKKLPDVKSMADLIAYAKANPGKLNYSSGGVGNFAHLAMELLGRATGTKYVHVPFTGVGPGMQAVVAGDVEVMFNNVATVLEASIAGQLRALGVGEPQRLKGLPDLPAIAETVPGYEMAAWTGIIGPAGIPRPIVDRMAKAIAESLDDPEVVALFERQHMIAIKKGPEAFVEQIKGDLVKWNKVIDEAGIKIAQ